MTKRLFLLLALIPFACAFGAEDPVKARLEKSPRHLEWVTVKHGNREVKCFVAYPEVKNKATAVVVIHEIFGLSDWVRGFVDQLAEVGPAPLLHAPVRQLEAQRLLGSRLCNGRAHAAFPVNSA